MRLREMSIRAARGFAAHRAWTCATLGLMLAGCASPPATRLHTLMPAQPVARAAAATAAPLAVVVEPIRIPAQVDQPQWLVRLPDDSLALLEQERWAAPLQDELRMALLEALGGRFGMVEATTGSASPWRIRLDLRRFDSVPGREARIEGSWLLGRSEARQPGFRCDWRFAEPAAAGGIPALAAAHRRAVLRLAGALGESLQKLNQGETPTCPARDDSP